MRTQWNFHHCNGSKNKARDYWKKKEPRFDRLLSRVAKPHKLVMTLYRHRQRDEWELRATLHTSAGTITVEETRPTLHETIDMVADMLAEAIRRQKSEAQKRILHRRRKHRRKQFAAATPYLQLDASADRTNAFVSLVMPYADQLYDHAKREIINLESQGRIPKASWSPTEIVDELLVWACENYRQRFEDTAIDVWLMDQLNRLLEELGEREKPLSMVNSEESAQQDSETDSDDVDYWLERLINQPSSPTLEEMIPDEHWDESWDEMDRQEQIDQLAYILQELPKHQRQTLMLSDAYGFDIFEIVRALGRSKQDVEADLATAREQIRAGLPRFAC